MEREWGSAKANTTWCILRCFWKRQRAEIQHLQSILWNNGPNSQTVDLAVDQGIRQNRDSYCQPKKHQLMQLFCTHWHTQYLSKYQSPPKSVLWEYDPLVMEYVLSHQTFTFDLHSCLSYPIFKDSHSSTQYWVQVINPVLCLSSWNTNWIASGKHLLFGLATVWTLDRQTWEQRVLCVLCDTPAANWVSPLHCWHQISIYPMIKL